MAYVNVQNGTAYTVFVNGTAVSAGLTSAAQALENGALILTCPGIVGGSCNLLGLDALELSVRDAGSAVTHWMYSTKDTFVGPAPCAGGPVHTVGALCFLCFAEVQLNCGAGGATCSLAITAYTPTQIPDALNIMVGNPTVNTAARGTLPCGLFSTGTLGSASDGVYFETLTPANAYLKLIPNAPLFICVVYFVNDGANSGFLMVNNGGAVFQWEFQVATPWYLVPNSDAGGDTYVLYGGGGLYASIDPDTHVLNLTTDIAQATPVGVLMELFSQLNKQRTLTHNWGAVATETTLSGAGVVLLFKLPDGLYTFDAYPINDDKWPLTLIKATPDIIDLTSAPGFATDTTNGRHVQYLVLPQAPLDGPALRGKGWLSCFQETTVGCPGASTGDNATCLLLDTNYGALVCGSGVTPDAPPDAAALQSVISACAANVYSSCAPLDGAPLASCTGWHALATQTVCAEACLYAPGACDEAKLAYCAAHPNVPECACLNLASNPTPAAAYGKSYAEYVCGMEAQHGINPETEYHGQCWWPLCDADGGGALTLSTTQTSSVCPSTIAECYTLLANNVGVSAASVQSKCGFNTSSHSGGVHCGGTKAAAAAVRGAATLAAANKDAAQQPLSAAALYGIVAGLIVLVLAGVGVGVGLYFRKRRTARQRTPLLV